MNRARWGVPRREFLSRVACGAAAAVAAPGNLRWGMAAEDRWKMRLSASSIIYTGLPIEHACQQIAALGFEAIDIWSAFAHCPHLDDIQKRLGPEGLKELLAKNNLRLFAFSVYVGGYPRYAELLGKAGGGVAIRGSAGGRVDSRDLTARMKAFLESLKPELALAEKHNAYLAVENHGGALLNSLDSLKAFVDLNKNPRLGIALAPLHLQNGKVSVPEAIGVVGRQLFFFYAWQSAAGVGQLPGHGPTDFTPWIAALAKAGYGGYVNPFMHHEPSPETVTPALVKSRDYLKACYAKAVPA